MGLGFGETNILMVMSLDPNYLLYIGFSGGSVVKNPPADAGDTGSVSGLEDALEKETATHSSILA